MGRKSKKSKSQMVLEHLLRHKTITSEEAWTLYGESRLSAVIHVLRHKKGYNIETRTIHPVDRWGTVCNCGEYHLIEGD